MAVAAADVAGVVQSATASAGAIERANQQSDAADSGSGSAEPFDVWSHTAVGAEGRPSEGLRATAQALAEGVSGDWARAGPSGTGASLERQASDALKEFQLLTGQREPDEDEAAPEGFLAGVGATFGVLTSLEQMISAPLSMLPFPAFPAIRVTDMDVGLPHGHAHPPNTPPPPPSPPVMLPSTGPIIPIPLLSGATTTLINGMPAARCGDMGLGVWCGGYFPMYEVFLGSSSVWIEGARAGRLLVDVTRHCIFSAPKPQDPPVGPMVGMTVTSSPNVLIGGVPMPSLLDMAMGAAIQGLCKGLGKALKKVKAARAARAAPGDDQLFREIASLFKRKKKKPPRPPDGEYWDRLIDARFVQGTDMLDRVKHAYRLESRAIKEVDELLAKGRIVIKSSDQDLVELVKKDLYQMAANPVGRQTLDRIGKRGRHKTVIKPGRGSTPRAGSPKRQEAYWDEYANGPRSGASTTVEYDPTVMEGPGWPPDSVLNHEMAHAANNAEGVNRARSFKRPVKKNGKLHPGEVPPNPEPASAQPGLSRAEREAAAKDRYTNLEEQNVIRDQDNPYREQYNLNPRWGHKNLRTIPPS